MRTFCAAHSCLLFQPPSVHCHQMWAGFQRCLGSATRRNSLFMLLRDLRTSLVQRCDMHPVEAGWQCEVSARIQSDWSACAAGLENEVLPTHCHRCFWSLCSSWTYHHLRHCWMWKLYAPTDSTSFSTVSSGNRTYTGMLPLCIYRFPPLLSLPQYSCSSALSQPITQPQSYQVSARFVKAFI